MGSKRVWQLKHTARARARAHTHTHARARVMYTRREWVQGKTAGENASGVKKNYARGTDERALFTLRTADYARRHAREEKKRDRERRGKKRKGFLSGSNVQQRQAGRSVICRAISHRAAHAHGDSLLESRPNGRNYTPRTRFSNCCGREGRFFSSQTFRLDGLDHIRRELRLDRVSEITTPIRNAFVVVVTRFDLQSSLSIDSVFSFYS